jgi:hypothetical protein
VEKTNDEYGEMINLENRFKKKNASWQNFASIENMTF